MSDYEKVVAINSYLVKSVKYDNAYLYNYSAYGALIGNKAVCGGFASAAYLLARKAGLESYYAQGSLNNVAHGWNIVKIDGSYYQSEPQTGTVGSDKQFEENGYEIWVKGNYTVCSSELYDYQNVRQ